MFLMLICHIVATVQIWRQTNKFPLTCNFSKMIQMLTLRGREIRRFFDLDILFWYILITSSVIFNLLQRVRYLQFKPDTLHRLAARHLKTVRFTVTSSIAEWEKSRVRSWNWLKDLHAMSISMGVQLTFEPILQLSVNVEDHSFILNIG